MNWQSFWLWLGGAWAAFVVGFIEGCPIGAPAGAGMALADGQVSAEVSWHRILIEVAHVLAVPFFSGLAELKSYTKSDPFPNVFQVVVVKPGAAPFTQTELDKISDSHPSPSP